MGNGMSQEKMMDQLRALQNANDARQRSQARQFMQLFQAQQSHMAQNQMMMMMMMMMSGRGAGSQPDFGQLMIMFMMNGGALPFAGGMPQMGGGRPQLTFSSDSDDDQAIGFPGYGMMKTKK